MKLLSIFILFYSITLISCVSHENDYKGRFSKDIKQNFSTFDYVVDSYGSNTYYNMVTLNIDKKYFSYGQFEKTIEKLKNNKWDLKYKIDNYYWVFCRGRNESIRILYPNNKVLKDRGGNYFREDLDSNKIYIWISYYQDENRNRKITGCPID